MTQHTPNIRITFVQRQPNVFDIGQKLIVHMLYKCFVFTVETIQPHNRGCTWVRKRIQRTAKRQFLGAEDRGLQFLNSVKNEAKNVFLV